MASPAVAKPKPAQSEAADHSMGRAPIPPEIAKFGFVIVPPTIELVWEKCTPIAARVVWHIWKNTIGDSRTGRNPWTKVSFSDLAEQLDCSKESIADAIQGLLGDESGRQGHTNVPLLEAKGTRNRQYRCIWQNWAKFEWMKAPAQVEEHEQETEEAATEELVPRGPYAAIRPRRSRCFVFEKPATKLQLFNESDLPIDLAHSPVDANGIVSVFAKYSSEKTTPITGSGAEANASAFANSSSEKTTTIKGSAQASAARGNSPIDERRAPKGEARANRAPADQPPVHPSENFPLFIDIFVSAGKAMNKGDIKRAETVWHALSLKEKMLAVRDAEQVCLEREPQFIPLPANYLREKPWTRRAAERTLPLIDSKAQKSIRKHQEVLRLLKEDLDEGLPELEPGK